MSEPTLICARWVVPVEPAGAELAAKLPTWARPTEVGPVADMLARGYGYAVLRYTDIQPDNAASNQGGIRALAYASGQTQPRPLDQRGKIICAGR